METTTTPNNSILIKIQGLLNLANNNSNVEEAALAASRAQELCDKYRLDLAAIEEDTGHQQNKEEISKDHAPLYRGQRSIYWKTRLAVGLCEPNGCKVFLRGGNIQIVGRKTNSEIVRYMFSYLSKEIERLCAQQLVRGGGKTWANNFKIGAVNAISDRLKVSQKETFKSYTGTTALVVVKQESEEVEQWTENNMNLSRGKTASFRGHSSARNAGYDAGSKIPLNKGMGAGTSSKRLN